jgi:hypothetical protein
LDRKEHQAVLFRAVQSDRAKARRSASPKGEREDGR